MPSTITIRVRAPDEGGTISTPASVSASTSDPNTANNTATESTTVTASADLAITKTGPAQVDAGTSFSYTLTVTNNGPSTATQIQVTDPPLGATITAVSANGGGFTTCGFNSTTNTATCSGGSLAKNAVATITLTVTAPSEGGAVTNAATVNAQQFDSNLANNTSPTVTTTVRAVADLAITKTGPAQVDAGTSFSYTLTVTNNGPSTATQIQVPVPPLGATITAVSASGGCFTTCGFNSTTNTVFFLMIPLPTRSTPLPYPTLFPPSEGGAVTNAATVNAQ